MNNFNDDYTRLIDATMKEMAHQAILLDFQLQRRDWEAAKVTCERIQRESRSILKVMETQARTRLTLVPLA